jgi:hypothetical protein
MEHSEYTKAENTKNTIRFLECEQRKRKERMLSE